LYFHRREQILLLNLIADIAVILSKFLRGFRQVSFYLKRNLTMQLGSYLNGVIIYALILGKFLWIYFFQWTFKAKSCETTSDYNTAQNIKLFSSKNTGIKRETLLFNSVIC
jgi:membrane-bound metal-dependent hydrolase YbcI (DUF457 family)